MSHGMFGVLKRFDRHSLHELGMCRPHNANIAITEQKGLSEAGCEVVEVSQLRDDLFRLVLLRHCSPPRWHSHTSSRTTSLGVDHRAQPRSMTKCGSAASASSTRAGPTCTRTATAP